MSIVPRTSLVVAALVAVSLVSAAAATVKFKHVVSAYADDAGVGLNAPEGVACGAQGQVVVGDTGNDRLVRFTFKDGVMTAGSAIKIPQLTTPSRVSVSAKGDIYAIDNRQRRIVHLGSDGAFKESVRFDGIATPATVVPKGLALDATDRLYVLDVFGARVVVLDTKGAIQRVVVLPAGIGSATDLTVDDAGDVVVLDAIKRRLLVAKSDAKTFTLVDKDLSDMVTTLPTSLVANKGSLFVLEGAGGRVTNLAKDGTFLTRQLTSGPDEGALNHPAQMCVNDADLAFIADRDNQRIAVFQLLR